MTAAPTRRAGPIPQHPTARAAVTAAQHLPQWGAWAAIRYAERRAVPMRLLGLALALERAATARTGRRR